MYFEVYRPGGGGWLAVPSSYRMCEATRIPLQCPAWKTSAAIHHETQSCLLAHLKPGISCPIRLGTDLLCQWDLGRAAAQFWPDKLIPSPILLAWLCSETSGQRRRWTTPTTAFRQHWATTAVPTTAFQHWTTVPTVPVPAVHPTVCGPGVERKQQQSQVKRSKKRKQISRSWQVFAHTSEDTVCSADYLERFVFQVWCLRPILPFRDWLWSQVLNHGRPGKLYIEIRSPNEPTFKLYLF